MAFQHSINSSTERATRDFRQKSRVFKSSRKQTIAPKTDPTSVLSLLSKIARNSTTGRCSIIDHRRLNYSAKKPIIFFLLRNLRHHGQQFMHRRRQKKKQRV